MLKDFLNHIRLVDEADDSHLSLALGAGKGVGLIDLSDEVGPALLDYLQSRQEEFSIVSPES